MADKSSIEWCDATWNPITGCSVISPGCTNCYAMKLAGGRLRHHPSRTGLTVSSKAGPVWNGHVRLNDEWLDRPLRWQRPRRIFVCAHGDLFHPDVPDRWIDQVFAVMAMSPEHQFQVLTKRPERMRDYLQQVSDERDMQRWVNATDYLELPSPCAVHLIEDADWPLPNVWLGTSVEDQVRADNRIGSLLRTPAAVRFVSAEPLLGPVSLDCQVFDTWPEGCGIIPGYSGTYNSLAGTWMPAVGNWEEELRGRLTELPRIDWVIVGGESGPGARPMHPKWVRSLRNQCRDSEVPFFFKQWGAWSPKVVEHYPVPDNNLRWLHPDGRCGKSLEIGDEDEGPPWLQIARVGKKAAGRTLDGRTWDEMPEGRQ